MPHKRSQIFLPMFSAKIVIVSALTFRCLIHFEVFCVWREIGIQLISFACGYSVVSAPFHGKKLTFYHQTNVYHVARSDKYQYYLKKNVIFSVQGWILISSSISNAYIFLMTTCQQSTLKVCFFVCLFSVCFEDSGVNVVNKWTLKFIKHLHLLSI